MRRMTEKKTEKKNRPHKGAACLLLACLMMAALPGCGKEAADPQEPTTARAPIDKSKTARNLVKKAEEGAVMESSESPKLGDYTTDDVKAEDGEAASMKTIDQMEMKFSSENGLMNIEVNAPVLIPECDAYPILSVRRGSIDDTLLKKVKEALLQDTQLYDGIRLYDPIVEQTLARGEKPDPAWKIGGQVPYSEITDYPVTPGLRSVKDLSKGYAEVEHFKDYYQSLMPDGELFYGVTDGKDGTYANLAVTNSVRYGSSLKFFKSRDYNVKSGLVLPGFNVYGWPVEQGIGYLYDEKKNPVPPVGVPLKVMEITYPDGEIGYEGDGTVDPDFTGFKTTESTKETNQLTKEEAVRQAEELLQCLGLSEDYAVAAATDEYITDPEHINNARDAEGKYCYDFTVGRAWHIIFQRSVNGNIVENYGEKYSKREEKKVWFGEVVEVYVNDNGIVGLAISDPLRVDEEVVKDSKLLDLEEIRKIYQNSQLEALNQSPSFDSILSMTREEAKEIEEPEYTFKIDKVILRYVMVSEKNEYERGLLVPVWSFEGTCVTDQGNVHAEGSFLQINAIDGTVFNAELGF